MAGLWRSYQVLMTKYPWTVQLVTAGTNNSSLYAADRLVPQVMLHIIKMDYNDSLLPCQ